MARYSAEFKKKVASAVNAGGTVAGAARIHRVSPVTVRKWAEKYRSNVQTDSVQFNVDPLVVITTLRSENTRLKSALAELYLRTVN